jgi:hypothetical protein
MANETPSAKTIRKVVGGYEQSEINVYLGRLEREIPATRARFQDSKDVINGTLAAVRVEPYPYHGWRGIRVTSLEVQLVWYDLSGAQG